MTGGRKIRRARVLVVGALTALLLTACSTVGPTAPVSSPPATAAPATASPASTPPVITPAPTQNPNFLLVALGDSIPGGLNCPDGCTGYVEAFAPMLATAIGRQVDVANLATNDSLTSPRLLNRLQVDPRYRDGVADAEFITIQIGFNDFQGPCSWTGHEACLAKGTSQVAANLAAILARITEIRAGASVPIRVLTYYDNYLGDPNAASVWGFDPTAENVAAFNADYGAALATFNDVLCAAAVDAGAICVDLVPAFNGPDGTAPAIGLVSPDGVHPTTAGHVLIAETLLAAGLADLEEAAP